MKRLLSFLMAFVIVLSLPISGWAADFSWVIDDTTTYVSVPGSGSDYVCDADPGMYYDGSNLYFVYSCPGMHWRRFVGSGMDDLQELPESKLVGFDQPHNDDWYWLCGLWVDEETGTWYTTVHVEFNYGDGKTHERYIGYATSTDQAATWVYQETIISGDNPEFVSECPGRYEPFGTGDQKFFVDEASGYIYIRRL